MTGPRQDAAESLVVPSVRARLSAWARAKGRRWLRRDRSAEPPPFQVPARFNRNSPDVVRLMPPEESGRWLLERMRRHLGIEDFATKSLLDYGCGVRFTQAILNLGLPIGQYAGVDCDRDMIEFLSTTVKDPRFSYHRLDARHRMYNPRGKVRLGRDSRLPLPEGHFDVVSMFSVITHQYPDATKHLLAMLRRYVNPQGLLFFTCFLDDTIARFADRSPQQNGGRCHYNAYFLDEIVDRAGWETVARHPAAAPLIGDSYVCRVAPEPSAAKPQVQFADVCEPTEAELREWAAIPDADYPDDNPDWDMIVADWSRADLIAELAGNESCPNRELFLEILYTMAGNCVYPPWSGAIPHLRSLLERLDGTSSESLRLFRLRAAGLLEDPPKFDYERWRKAVREWRPAPGEP